MVLFNYALKELTAKIVYYGPGLSGKTTNLQYIYEELPIKNKGRMLTLATETDRTLYFDFLPVEAGIVRGIKTRIQLYTVPGQVYYNATRQMVLKGADGVVFVADSQGHLMESNHESMANLRENLLAHDLRLEELPLVLQYNKRDLPGVLSLDEMNDQLNPLNIPFYEAIAVEGIGVEDTLRAISNLVLKSVIDKYGGTQRSSTAGSRVSAADPHAITTPSFGAGWKGKEMTDPFGTEASLFQTRAGKVEPPRSAEAAPRETRDDVRTFPALLADRNAENRQVSGLRDIFEELNLEEMLGEALGPSEPSPVAPSPPRPEPPSEPDLAESLALETAAGESEYAVAIEEALQIDAEEAPLPSLSDENDIVFFTEPSADDSVLPGAPEENTPVPAAKLTPRRATAAAALEVEVDDSAELSSGGPRRVLVPIQLTIDRDAEEMELQITLQIRVSRANRG